MTLNSNWFATFALLSWILVALWLYVTQPIGRATYCTILGAYLLLPVGTDIKFEMIPAFNKVSLPNLAALCGCAWLLRRPLKSRNGFGLTEILMLVYLFSPFITAELNTDPVVLANKVLPPESHYDALSAVVTQFLSLIPFLLGRRLLQDSDDIEELLRVLVIAGLMYSLPMLAELRLSPQLHFWFYGYYPHEFQQAVRDGGYRPMVFIGHGLNVAFFTMTAFVAATAFWRTQTRVLRLSPIAIVPYLGILLFLCKSYASYAYASLLVPLVRFVSPRTQFKFAVILATLALSYPILRVANLVPTSRIIEVAESINPARAQSLKERFENEALLLQHANERFLFGWGRWGRSRVYHEESGRDLSPTDGRWIITVGQFGLVGFLAEFGLLTLCVHRAASAFRFAASMRDRIFLATLSLIVAINIIDLLPNSSINPWLWLLVGGLLGRAEALRFRIRQHKTVALA